MGKFFGKVGYAISQEEIIDNVKTGVWIDSMTEIEYFGDVIRRKTNWQQRQQVNDDLAISIQISIMADPFAEKNFSSIKYVEYMGQRWKVTEAEPAWPRIILTLGGVWNGEIPEATTT